MEISPNVMELHRYKDILKHIYFVYLSLLSKELFCTLHARGLILL